MSKKNEKRFTGAWDDAEVHIKRNSKKLSTMTRKVVTKGIKHINNDKLINRITKLLRSGYEVRISDAIRIYPCMEKDLKTMFAASQTIGEFRSCLGDIKAKTIWRGKEVDPDEKAGEAKARNNEYKRERAEKIEVTPDTMVTCPECGAEFRVGRAFEK